MAVPIDYAKSDDVHIAYTVVGNGPIDLVIVLGWVLGFEHMFTLPDGAHFVERLSSMFRVILFDKRGTGRSDRLSSGQVPDLESRMDDVRAVMDAAGSQRAVLFGISEGGPMCCLFAATYPDRTSALVLHGAYAREAWAPDYPFGLTDEQYRDWFEGIRTGWVNGDFIRKFLYDAMPSVADDPKTQEWFVDACHRSVTPGAVVAYDSMTPDIDVRSVLHPSAFPRSF